MTAKPIFIISLPRSGSTLLQKILMTHSQIASHPEPWILLPLVYMHKKVGIKTEYGHTSSAIALNTIYKHLPSGKEDYYQMIRHFALCLYTKLSNGEPFFVDKTPRYYFIIPEIKKIFPDAKFIILIRNPLSIFASCIEAFKENTVRRLDHLDRDLFVGPKRIAAGVKYLGENGLVARYEDLVKNSESEIGKILTFLGVTFEQNLIERSFVQKIDGYGDHLGARKYTYIKNQTNKWKTIINTPYRKWRIKRFIKQIDTGYLTLCGFTKKELLQAIHAHRNVRQNPSEYVWAVEECLARLLKKIIKYKPLS